MRRLICIKAHYAKRCFEGIMKIFHHELMAAAVAIGLCVAMSAPGFAAQRSRHADRQAPVKQDRSITQPAHDASRLPPYHPQGTSSHPWGPGYNLPYPDRPYGTPDRW
jgi:hypothetical protein